MMDPIHHCLGAGGRRAGDVLVAEARGGLPDSCPSSLTGRLGPALCPRAETPPAFTRKRKVLEDVFESARDGRGQAMLVRGEPGLGKTTLLDDTLRSTSGFKVAMIGGVEAERDLSFAGLQRLCAPMMDRLDALPDPQRDALKAAFGEGAGGEIDPFFMGLAVLRLFAAASADRPLVCIVDDAHWLDGPSIQVLAFVARRLRTQSAALVFAVSEPVKELDGLPELMLDGLSGPEAHALLASVIPYPIDTRVRDRIVAESQGNPRALLSSLHGLTPEQGPGGFGVPASLPLVGRPARVLRSRLEELPAPARCLLLVAAAEPDGDPALLWRAAAHLGIDATAADDAESAGLVEFGIRVTFRDPWTRSVIYHDAPLDERRRVHQALADATELATDPDRWAWHRANATRVPDADVADALERSARRAQQTGGLAVAAAFLKRSALLTPEPARRAVRALEAAHAKFEAGSLAVASELLTVAATGSLDDLERARLARLRAKIAFAVRPGADAAQLLLDAANRLATLDVRLARDTYLEALEATMVAGRFAGRTGLVDVAEAALAAPKAESPCGADLLLDGLAVLITDGYAAAASPLGKALEAFSRSDDIRWYGLACRVAAALWDLDAMRALANRYIRAARDTGALTELAVALGYLARLQVHAGELTAAARLIDDAEVIIRTIGYVRIPHSSLWLASWRGSEAETVALIEASRRDGLARGDGRELRHTEHAAAVLYNGLGRYAEALHALQHACESEELLTCVALPELIEAAARSGELDVAVAACERLVAQTHISNTEWALGIEARSLALVTEGPKAEKLYRQAIERLGRCHAGAHVARAHLVYGEWLRRQSRRVDAREQLRTAHDMFTTMGATAFADRAHRELLATGERARKRTVETTGELTPQEAQIAWLAREGESNPQIAAKLFISARTVEYHMHKVLTKLGITSRVQLAAVLDLETKPSSVRHEAPGPARRRGAG